MSENNTEVKRVRTSELIPQIQEIESLTKTLRNIVNSLPEGSVKGAYEFSVKNLEAKNEKFLNAGVKLEVTPEQKEIARLIKQGKFAEAQEKLSALSANMESSAGSNDEPKTAPAKKRGNKN